MKSKFRWPKELAFDVSVWNFQVAMLLLATLGVCILSPTVFLIGIVAFATSFIVGYFAQKDIKTLSELCSALADGWQADHDYHNKQKGKGKIDFKITVSQK